MFGPLAPNSNIATSFLGQSIKGSMLTVDEFFREVFERVGITGASLDVNYATSALNTATFMLGSWCARSSFSWMRQRRFFGLATGQVSYPLPLGLRNLESVVYTCPVNGPLGDQYLGGSAVFDPNIEGMTQQTAQSLMTSSTNAPFTVVWGGDNAPPPSGWTPWIGWQFSEPATVSYVGVVPQDTNSVLSFVIETKATPANDPSTSWQVVKVCGPDLYMYPNITWQTLENPVAASCWRVSFLLTDAPIANQLSLGVPCLRGLVFATNVVDGSGALPAVAGSGAAVNQPVWVSDAVSLVQSALGTADRSLGEIAYSDWMALPDKRLASSSPTSYMLDNKKTPWLYLWPLIPDTGPQGSIPGILYTSYLPPRDMVQLFQMFDVPAIFIDALAADLAYRMALKIKPEDQIRIQLLKAGAEQAFGEAVAADAQAAGFNLNINADFSPLSA